jgi:hypothetical protein
MKPKRHPEEYTDTDPRAMEVWLDTLRAKTPGERMSLALQLTNLAIQVSAAGVRSRHPHASEEELAMRSAALRLPRELMIAAYGWDPDRDGRPV